MNVSQFKVGLKVKIVNFDDIHFNVVGKVVSINEEYVKIRWSIAPKDLVQSYFLDRDFSWMEPLTPLEQLL